MKEAVSSAANNPAVGYKGSDDSEVVVSYEGWGKLLETARAVWSDTLFWFSDNPLFFFGVLFLIAFIFWTRSKHKVERDRLKAQYDEVRRIKRQELEPPLPLLEGPGHTGDRSRRDNGR